MAKDESPSPSVRVLRGGPDEVDVAAVTAVLSAYQAGQSAAADPEPARPAAAAGSSGTWACRSRGLRPPVHPGPDAWRWSRP